jgi:hypothetical protein
MKQTAILADGSRLGKPCFLVMATRHALPHKILAQACLLSSIVYTGGENVIYDCGHSNFFGFSGDYCNGITSIIPTVNRSGHTGMANGTAIAFVIVVESDGRCRPRCCYFSK